MEARRRREEKRRKALLEAEAGGLMAKVVSEMPGAPPTSWSDLPAIDVGGRITSPMPAHESIAAVAGQGDGWDTDALLNVLRSRQTARAAR